MRDTHIYTSTVDPHHPIHFMQNPTQTRRNIHLTPLHNTLPPVQDDRSVRTPIHTEMTRRALDTLPLNSVLGVRPPAACETKHTRDRRQRVQLGQLRCGHSTLVLHASYMHRLGLASADTEHVLLHCPHTQQQRRITDDIHSQEHLCNRPVEVSNFLPDLSMMQRST